MQGDASTSNAKNKLFDNDIERLNLFKLSKLFVVTKTYKSQLNKAAALIRGFFIFTRKLLLE
jgi:hypothetical protein